jgi:SPP1 gp7 family putative phage head morphogenesis protein
MTPAEKIAAIRNRRAAAKAAGKRLPRKRKPPRQLYPHGLEREYERAVLRVTDPFFEAVGQMVKRDLPAIVAARDVAFKADGKFVSIRRDASYGEMIGRVFEGIRINVAAHVTESAAGDTAGTFGQRVSDFNRTQVDRQFTSVLGIPVLRRERWLEDKLSAFVTGNVSLIKDISEKGIADIQSLLMARVEAGDSNATIAKLVQEKLEVTKRRAQFIARDQVAKLNGKLTELRQKETGVEEYIWRAVKDGATRASHLANDGKRFRWDDPPETGHPGEDYQCRCTAEPVLDAFMAVPLEEAA